MGGMLRPVSVAQNWWLGGIVVLLLATNVQGSNIYNEMVEEAAQKRKQAPDVKAMAESLKALAARVDALEIQRKADHAQAEREHAMIMSKSKAMDDVCDRLSKFMEANHVR